MSAKIRMLLRNMCLVALIGLTGCLGRVEQINTVEITRMKMGTPAYVLAPKAGKAQVLTVQVPKTDPSTGNVKWVSGRLDANGMVLIDEPTLELYRKVYAEHGPKEAK